MGSPGLEMVDLARLLIQTKEKTVFFVTGRPQFTRDAAMQWLLANWPKVDNEAELMSRR